MKIAVVGTGYVGLSIATLLALYNEVVAVNIVLETVPVRPLSRIEYLRLQGHTRRIHLMMQRWKKKW